MSSYECNLLKRNDGSVAHVTAVSEQKGMSYNISLRNVSDYLKCRQPQMLHISNKSNSKTSQTPLFRQQTATT
jgi:hypothetical protein